MPTISIIMPIYNLEQYLQIAAESVLNQSFDDIELILVDDGSTDSSNEICLRLAEKDSRVTYIRKKKQGTASARNAGIKEAQSPYIGFVDGDDWIEPDMLMLLYKNLQLLNAEISACGFVKIHNDAAIQFYTPLGKTQLLSPSATMHNMLLAGGMRYSSCNKLFHRKLFERVLFPEDCYVEDKAAIFHLVHQCQQVAWCPSKKYHYRIHPHSKMSGLSASAHCDLLKVNEELMAFIRENYPDLLRIAGASCAVEYYKLLRHVKTQPQIYKEIATGAIPYFKAYRAAILMHKVDRSSVRWGTLLYSLFNP